jgi:hypothetical protein
MRKEAHMSTPVYLLVLAKGYTEAWYQLSKEEQDALWAKVGEIDKRAGAQFHVFCNARWADEDLMAWGVIEYPSMEACVQKAKELEDMNWWRYISAKTILGTKMEE